MKLAKRFLSGLLLAALLSSLLVINASAAGFARTRTYSGQFTDVSSSAWYYENVKDCYELGLMNGTGDASFSPTGMFTVAEALTIAGRLHNIYNGGSGTLPSTSSDWQQNAANYCLSSGIITAGQFDNYSRNATRAEMAELFAAALPDSEWAPINSVTELPDVSASTNYYEAIFKLYNAGIVTGSDGFGTFQPHASVSRAEVAALAARCADPSQRRTFTLTPLSEREAPVIPGIFDSSNYKMSSGRMLFWDAETKSYGYIDTTGAKVIPAQYEVNEYASGFNAFSAYGYAVVALKDSRLDYGLIDTNGTMVIPNNHNKIEDLGRGSYKARIGKKYALIMNGSFKSDYIYDDISSSGLNFFAKKTDGDWDVYDINGTKVCSFAGTLKWKSGSRLFSVQKGGKCALATEKALITDYLYDSINLYADSTLAVLNYGTQQALAGENGIIFNLGEYTFRESSKNGTDLNGYCVVGDYALAYNGKQFALADATGIVSEFFYSINSLREPYLCLDNINNGIVMVRQPSGLGSVSVYWTMVYDAKSGTTYIPKDMNSVKSKQDYAELKDETYFLSDGTRCQSVEEVNDNYTYKDYRYFVKDGKYGLAYKGVTVSEAVYSSPEEAAAAYGYYEITKENGKPIVAYGNLVAGFTPVIHYYKNNMYYDEIKEVGEGYYACRYGTTWYLLHA